MFQNYIPTEGSLSQTLANINLALCGICVCRDFWTFVGITKTQKRTEIP